MKSNFQEYIKSFIIGSSLPVCILFLRAVSKYERKKIINFRYYDYSMLMPLYFGIMTIIAKYIQIKYKLTLRNSLLYVSLVSPLIIIFTITYFKVYKFNTIYLWLKQYLKMSIAHLFTYNIIIYYISSII